MGAASSKDDVRNDDQVRVVFKLDEQSLPQEQHSAVPHLYGSSAVIDSAADLDISKTIALDHRGDAWEMNFALPANRGSFGTLYYKFILVSTEEAYIAEECPYHIFNPHELSVTETAAVFKLGSRVCKAWVMVANSAFASQLAKRHDQPASGNVAQRSSKQGLIKTKRSVSIKDLVLLGSEAATTTEPEEPVPSSPSTPRYEDHQGLFVDRSPKMPFRNCRDTNLVIANMQLSDGAEDMPEAVGAVAAAAVSERMLLPKERRQLAIVLVGLPARGKTFTAVKLTRYLRWLGHDTKHFNVGKYRRLKHGCTQSADFFRGDNVEGVDARNEVAAFAMEDMLSWMDAGGQIGIFDATNTTNERRQMILQMAEGKCKVIFLETICNIQSIIDRNILLKIQQSPDYADEPDFEAAIVDFKTRLENYEKVYEPVEQGSYIKMINLVTGEGGQIQVNGISGYLPGRIVFFLVNTHITPRPILLTRHGESMYNLTGQIGGDAVLSPAGETYAEKLAEFINKHLESDTASIWTSTLQRTILTARHVVPFPKVQWRALDEINAGICDGMTYEEIKEKMPDEYAARKADKLRYRYPRGESYLDVIQRLEPVIIELERQRAPVVVIAHQAVLRSLYAYFADKPLKEIPHIEVPLHTVIEIQMGMKGIEEKRHKLMD